MYCINIILKLYNAYIVLFFIFAGLMLTYILFLQIYMYMDHWQSQVLNLIYINIHCSTPFLSFHSQYRQYQEYFLNRLVRSIKLCITGESCLSELLRTCLCPQSRPQMHPGMGHLYSVSSAFRFSVAWQQH